MLDIDYIRNHAAEVKDAVRKKRYTVDVDRLLAVDAARRAAIKETDVARQRRNELSAAIPKLAPAERPAAVAEAKGLRDRIAALESALAESQAVFDRLMLLVPTRKSSSFSIAKVSSRPSGKKPVPSIACSRTITGGATAVKPFDTTWLSAKFSTAISSSTPSPVRA